MNDFWTPVGAAALIIGVISVIVREFKDRPRIQRIEEDRALDAKELKELREANAGLRTMIAERIDFAGAIAAMGDMAKSVKVAIESGHALRNIMTERYDAHSRATSEEHTAIVTHLREQTEVLKDIQAVLAREPWSGEERRLHGKLG